MNSDIVGLNRERARGRDPLTVTTPPLEAECHKKSTKLLNPEPLTDGITPLIDDFVATIKNILTINTNHYLTAASRIAFIKSQVRNPAKGYICERLKTIHLKAFQDASEVLDTL